MISTLAFHIFISKSKITQEQHILFSQLTVEGKGQMYTRRTNTQGIKLKNLCFWFCLKFCMCLLIFEILYLFLCLDRGINRTSRNILASGVQ